MRPSVFSATRSAQRLAPQPHGKASPSTVESLYSFLYCWAVAGIEKPSAADANRPAMRAVKRRFCMGSVSVVCLFFRLECAAEDGKEERFYKPEGPTASAERAGRIERAVREPAVAGRGASFRGRNRDLRRSHENLLGLAHLHLSNPGAAPPHHDALPPTAARIRTASPIPTRPNDSRHPAPPLFVPPPNRTTPLPTALRIPSRPGLTGRSDASRDCGVRRPRVPLFARTALGKHPPE